eukprot:TRINITY_DN5847_c0_g1_i2.p1 TRINITY_DN5847_c0_g1~~TRINITY_DN5847_c0_g1_i2.p1  ORF type:complete len:118 (-),score=17.53 TRINITY_DN5847_c0_g1_i2:463-816(-)
MATKERSVEFHLSKATEADIDGVNQLLVASFSKNPVFAEVGFTDTTLGGFVASGFFIRMLRHNLSFKVTRKGQNEKEEMVAVIVSEDYARSKEEQQTQTTFPANIPNSALVSSDPHS